MAFPTRDQGIHKGCPDVGRARIDPAVMGWGDSRTAYGAGVPVARAAAVSRAGR